MAIPIISDIIGSIQKVIDWIQRTIPRPVQFLFFFMFILFIGTTLLPIFFNMTGTFCIDDTKYTNEFYDVTTNIATTFKIMNLPRDDNESLGTIDVEQECLQNLRNSTNVSLWYQGVYCTNCTRIGPFHPLYDFTPLGDNSGTCGSDAYRIPNEEKTILQRWFCESKGDETLIAFSCEPPVGFHFSMATRTYVCHDLPVCGNTSELVYLKQSLIQDSFTEVPTVEGADPDLVGIKCVGNSPKFAVVGIDLFNWSIWLFIFLLTILLVVWFKFR